jgi:RNA polymerase sigma factor (sigma-70 family)
VERPMPVLSLHTMIRRLRQAAGAGGDGVSDAALLERFVERHDEAAFELLLWRYGPMVLGVCRRLLRSEHDAEDAFQAAFLMLARKAASLRRRDAVGAWIYRTAHRIALAARAYADKRLGPVPPDAEPTAHDSDDLLWRDLRPVLDEEILRLPKRYQTPILLCHFGGRTHEEAAREIGCPKGTVSVRLARGRELLRKRLVRRGLGLTAAALAASAAATASAAAPAALIQTTLQAALPFAAGKAVATAASARAVALAQGVIRTMFHTKLKILAGATALIAVTCLGASLWMTRTGATEPPGVAKPAAPPAADPDPSLVEVCCERDGRLVLLGTEIKEGEKVAESDRVKLDVAFLAVETDRADEAEIAPKDGRVNGPDGKRFYRRWKSGDSLPPGKLTVFNETREFRKLHLGDAVAEGQLLAVIDPSVAVDDVAVRVAKLEAAETAVLVAAQTKNEAHQRWLTAKRLFEAKAISDEDFRAAQFNRDRYIEEEKTKFADRRVAERELNAALTTLKLHEIRSPERGVLKAFLKKRGEAVRAFEPVLRIQVTDRAPAAPDAKPGPEKPGDRSEAINVPSQRDGILTVVGAEIKDGEKVADDDAIAVAGRKYRRLREGDMVEEGQLLARVDDRLARIELTVKQSKLVAAEADHRAAVAVGEEAKARLANVNRLQQAKAIAEDEVRAAALTFERYVEEARAKEAAVKQAQADVEAAKTILEMYEIRSPIRGVVKHVAKSRGEAVKALETVIQIQEKP